MSSTQKHLHELLQEDQEPFQLNHYIADRRHQLKTKTTATHKFNNSALHPKKINKPLGTLCKQACFLSFYDSPDFRKSPLYTPTNISPNKSPSAAVFLHIPAKTAAMLLEAAMKIQKQSAKPKKGNAKNVGFGLFGSIFKRLKDKSKSNNKKAEIDIVNKSCRSSLNENETFIPNRKSTRSKRQKLEGIVEDDVINEKMSGNYINELGFSFSCNNSRLSSAAWSESNEDNKSLDMDMETSCSTSRSDYMEDDIIIHEFASSDKLFCLSPLSPFRFALQQTLSPGIRTPDLSSPPASPTRHVIEETENQLGDNLQKDQLENEEDKDQCSPVSVLDPPFEDDDDEQNGGGEKEEEENDDYDIECSYAFVQRAKLQFLHKLRRFERLAELDPVELEKRMSEEEDDDDEDLIEGEEWINIDESRSFCSKENDEFISEVLSKSNLCSLNKIPADFGRLVLDLIAEERKNEIDYTNEVILSNVCKRLDSWKEVESNTIDMMVELELRRELNGWKGYQEEAREKAIEIEIAIFGLLLEELVA